MIKEIFNIPVDDSVNIYTETFGNCSNNAVLFISGAGAGASFWSERLCKKIVDNGFFVIKYDHRDFGLSSKINYETNPYDFMQLVKDAIALSDAFKIEQAHIVGHSMGGFITQLLAIHYPERIQSIISASSSTNSPKVPSPKEVTWRVFAKNNPTNNFDKDLNGFLKVWEFLNGTAEFDKVLAVDYTKSLYQSQDVKGPLGESHVKAQSSLSDRSNELKQINIPALVIHGEEDYLVDKYGGIQTAECIKNSELILIPEMGHMIFNIKLLDQFEHQIIHFLKKQSL